MVPSTIPILPTLGCGAADPAASAEPVYGQQTAPVSSPVATVPYAFWTVPGVNVLSGTGIAVSQAENCSRVGILLVQRKQILLSTVSTKCLSHAILYPKN